MSNLKYFINENCKTKHCIPEEISIPDFKRSMGIVFGVLYIHRDKYGIPEKPAYLRSCLRLVGLGVLFENKSNIGPEFLPTPKFLSLYTGAKRQGFYYWAGIQSTQIEQLVAKHYKKPSPILYYGQYQKHKSLNT